MLPIPAICASSRIFSSRPVPLTSTDLSFKSDRSISLKHQVAGSQATRWPQAPSLFNRMWNSFALCKYRWSNLLTCYLSPQSFTGPSSAANTTEPNVSSCRGATYNIRPADDCHSISTNQKIGTGWLLTDNNLQAYCAKFPNSGSLCLVNRCDVYTLRQNDTCSEVAKYHSITENQLKAWNPVSPWSSQY